MTELDEITADDLEGIFHAALGQGDVKGVDAALRLLAVKDPRRAQNLFDLTKVALRLIASRDGRALTVDVPQADAHRGYQHPAPDEARRRDAMSIPVRVDPAVTAHVGPVPAPDDGGCPMTAPTSRHGRDIDGWINTRCAFGLDGCTDHDCVCTCHDVRVGPFAAQGFGCPKCGSILNAAAAGCDGGWHADNQPRLPAPTGPEPEERMAEQVAQLFHEAYERLAPLHGYKTRDASAATVSEVMAATLAQVSALQADVARLEGVLAEVRRAEAAILGDRGEWERLIAERDELQALFDLQWTCMQTAAERWRQESPIERVSTLPDLGTLLAWLMADRDHWFDQHTALDDEVGRQMPAKENIDV